VHVVARIGKAHGLRGEVTVQTHTDAPEQRFVVGAEFATQTPAGDEGAPLVLRSVRVHQGTYLLGFEGVPDRTSAEALRNTRLVAEEEPVDEEDGWYEEDLLGFAVALADGTEVGTVAALHIRPVQDLLEVRLVGGGRALVPFVDEIVPEVDEEARRVVIDPPDGLLDLGE
jgi:16S rRNA processing protein RimM